MEKIFFIITITLISLIMISCSDKKTIKAGYAGDDISEKATVLRDKYTKQASLEIETDGEWAIYSGSSVDSIDFSAPIAKGITKGTYALPVSEAGHSYFQLVTPEGSALLAEKHLPMTGGYNFRDMGGLKTKDSRYVKWGRVLRSDDLNHLTDADLNYLGSIPLIAIVDFRSSQEMEQAPDKTPASLKNRYELSISPGNLMNLVNESSQSIRMDSIMMELNKLLVSDTASIKQYREFFRLLQEEKNTPLLFHCSAGKDRTGMGAALFLFSLGVDEKTILEDYLSSNTYLGDKYAPLIAEHPELKPLMEVRAEYLKSALNEIKSKHGSIDKYLTEVLAIDINKMKELYLY